MLNDPIRAAIFREVAPFLDNWAEQVISEEPARPDQSGMLGMTF
jgi:hypothetical protein